MRRVKRPVVAALAALACAFTAHAARAQNCESTRPTDAGGTAGVSYGTAKVAFFDSPSGRARVHYALSGPSAPPAASTLQADVPDAVVVAAQAADEALDKYAQLKFLPPLSDGDTPCPSNGDSDAVDIYLINFAAADGQAVVDHCSAGKPKTCSGFVLVENDFRGGGYANTEEGLRTVVPHELFHLVQDAYDADVERWWAEGSAQWAAKQVYPELHDLERFLEAYFDNPSQPLDVPPPGAISSFLYATAIWPVFLHERFDAAVVREVFEAFDGANDGVLAATDAALQARGSSLAREFLEFAVYNSATGERAPRSGGYEHAADYPEVPFKPLDTAKAPLWQGVTAGVGAFYFSLSTPQPLQLSLAADPSRLAAVLLPLSSDGKPDLAAAQPLPAQANGDALIVLAGQSTLRTDANFELQAKAEGTAESSGCSVSRALDTTGTESEIWLGIALSGLGLGRARRRITRTRKVEK
jgi:hypothetical protein